MYLALRTEVLKSVQNTQKLHHFQFQLPFFFFLLFFLLLPLQEIKQKQKAQEELNSRPPSLPLPDVVPDGEAHYGQNGIPLLNGHVPLAPANHPGLQQANRNHGLLGGALANLFVIVGFAAFAYTVKYVLRSIAQE